LGARSRFAVNPVAADQTAVQHEKSPLFNGLFLQHVWKYQAAANQ
jgi:hypothetical protein